MHIVPSSAIIVTISCSVWCTIIFVILWVGFVEMDVCEESPYVRDTTFVVWAKLKIVKLALSQISNLYYINCCRTVNVFLFFLSLGPKVIWPQMAKRNMLFPETRGGTSVSRARLISAIRTLIDELVDDYLPCLFQTRAKQWGSSGHEARQCFVNLLWSLQGAGSGNVCLRPFLVPLLSCRVLRGTILQHDDEWHILWKEIFSFFRNHSNTYPSSIKRLTQILIMLAVQTLYHQGLFKLLTDRSCV